VMLRDGATQLRNEVGGAFRTFDEKVGRLLTQMLAQQAQMATRQQNAFNELRNAIDGRLALIQTGNEQKLEQMRQTVDEKLQGTLDARLGASFKHVSERLEQLYKGLGEVQSLASGVGDLKRVFTNVKTRGTWGEVQLGAILEQIMASAQ